MLYMNGVQAVFHLESLRNMVEISVVKLKIFEDYSPWNNMGGDRQPMYTEFCEYQGGTSIQPLLTTSSGGN